MCFGGNNKIKPPAKGTSDRKAVRLSNSDSAKEKTANSARSQKSRKSVISSPSSAYGSTQTGQTNTTRTTRTGFTQPAPVPIPPKQPSAEKIPADAVEKTAKSASRTDDGKVKSTHTWKSNKISEDDLPTLRIMEEANPMREGVNDGPTNNNTEASCSEWSVIGSKPKPGKEEKKKGRPPARRLKDILATAGQVDKTAAAAPAASATRTQTTQGDDDRLDRTQKNSHLDARLSRQNQLIEDDNKMVMVIPDVRTCPDKPSNNGNESNRKSVSLHIGKEEPTPLPIPEQNSTKREINKKSTTIQLRD